MPRRVASYDNASRSWYGQIPFDRPEWAAEMLTALFDTARLHGTDIRVQTPPASEDSPSGKELCLAGTSASARGSRPALFEHGYKGSLLEPPEDCRCGPGRGPVCGNS